MDQLVELWEGSSSLPLYGFAVRALIVYVYIFTMIKLLGQRSMATVDPLDFIFGVVIGDILGEPLATGDSELGGPFLAAATIGALHWSLSYIALKLPKKSRRFLEDEPYILASNGVFHEKILRKANMTIEQVLMELRQASSSDLNEIDTVVLEQNGKVSVIKKARFDQLTPDDMNISTNDKGYASVIISDGTLKKKNLPEHLSEEKFYKQLKKRGYDSADNIFLLTINRNNEWYISPKEDA
ncbi:DUF421 domain-containing protein [Geomicrobium sediminis]|uniref:Uncharacterized membrane protein YcaP (DUF421 family) n=1 Tax=Geomicrobium sediminis TaxID=1347788 RepID=A0ABS2PCB2_9BACL|nr:DUF421 domain-containing protein [Geomicrobium sediminis]MBM7632695.1 uncharacterized membrane protein YcaP (DUF421 family) [Geomicrobium sediminis]